MKLKIDRNQKDALQKACIENRFTVKFHEDEMNEDISIAYVRDDKLGELSPTLAFWLAVAFTTELYRELETLSTSPTVPIALNPSVAFQSNGHSKQ